MEWWFISHVSFMWYWVSQIIWTNTAIMRSLLTYPVYIMFLCITDYEAVSFSLSVSLFHSVSLLITFSKTFCLSMLLSSCFTVLLSFCLSECLTVSQPHPLISLSLSLSLLFFSLSSPSLSVSFYLYLYMSLLLSLSFSICFSISYILPATKKGRLLPPLVGVSNLGRRLPFPGVERREVGALWPGVTNFTLNHVFVIR